MAVIVVDNSGCTNFDQSCLPGASKNFGEGFSVSDEGATQHWYFNF
jgi:hypothetical protein